MDDRLIDFKLCIDKIGGFAMNSFEDRIAVQKKVYLLQLGGLDLGYRFSWYLRGPYSSSLSDTAFEVWNNIDLVKEAASEFELANEYLGQLGNISEIVMSESPFKELEVYKWLELLASLHYLKHVAFVPEEVKDRENLCKKLVELKGYFQVKHAYKAWDFLNKFGLIENKTILYCSK